MKTKAQTLPVLLLLVASATVLAQEPGLGPQFSYLAELELALKPARAVAVVAPAADGIRQRHLPDVSILEPEKLQEKMRGDRPIPSDFDLAKPTVILDRKKRVLIIDKLHSLSNLFGAVQEERVFAAQLELRWGEDARTMHALRLVQWAGPEIEQGFPCLAWVEAIQTRTADRSNQAQMFRGVLIHPETEGAPARIRVHHVGRFRRRSVASNDSRTVHVISEFKQAANGTLAVEIWTSGGERYPFLGFEDGLRLAHDKDWKHSYARSGEETHQWERPFMPFAAGQRGARPMSVLAVLDYASSWHRGGKFDGQPPKPRSISSKDGVWSISKTDLFQPTGMWRFDRRGELVLRTPLGNLGAKAVEKYFREHLKEIAEDEDEVTVFFDCMDVILNWAADMPQLEGEGPGRTESKLRKLLERQKRLLRKKKR